LEMNRQAAYDINRDQIMTIKPSLECVWEYCNYSQEKAERRGTWNKKGQHTRYELEEVASKREMEKNETHKTSRSLALCIQQRRHSTCGERNVEGTVRKRTDDLIWG